MPGLSQLKKFSSDLLSLGDEVVVRAGRGEKPVSVPIPKDVQDVDDSEDFVIGMPEGEELVEEEPIDDDLSDLAGIAGGDSNSSSSSEDDGDSGASSPFDAPDMSGLLDPIGGGDIGADDMPDLSMFADEPEPEPEAEEIIEEEPEEVSVADMGLDDLLAGGGFDQPEEGTDDFGELDNLEDIDDVQPLENVDELASADDLSSADDNSSDISDFGDFDFGGDDGVQEASFDGKENAEDASLDDFFYEPFGDENKAENNDEPVEDAEVLSEPEVQDFAEPESFNDNDDLVDNDNLSDSDDVTDAEKLSDFDNTDFGDKNEDDSVLSDLPDMSEMTEIDDIDESGTGDTDSGSDFDLPDFDDFSELGSEPASEPSVDSSVNEAVENPESENVEESPFEAPEILETSENLDENQNPSENDNLDELFDLPDMSDLDSNDVDGAENIDSVQPDSVLDDLGADNLDNSSDNELNDNVLDSLDEPENNVITDESDSRFEDSPEDKDLDSPFEDFSTDGLDDLPDFSSSSDSDSALDFSDSNPFDLDNNDSLDGANSFGSGDITAKDDIPDYGDFNLDDEPSGDSGASEPLEVFDTSEMEGLDFDIPDTDTQLESSDGGDIFAGGEEFEIPGFSDVDTVSENSSKSKSVVHEEKKKKGKRQAVPSPAKNEDIDENDEESENLPPNTLSDKQYKTFLKNLNDYPLNVRLAFEEMMVKDEFTEDAEFEIIEAILKKAPARQVAGKLEKMLDTSIPVPRDYEHRSAGEYEAYKKSLSYQLKNRIIPAVLLGIVGILVCIGLFNFGKNCIYKPLKANSLYKQGYALIQEREYPLSEIKFKEATDYRFSKKWFFNYARAYRDHKQYQRAGKMYKNILFCFNHDKVAGLEYADMELNDLANYERAEEIVRREVLDYHINDADGILKLGDIFLEWGTEKDPAKLEDAREQYATLLQLYGQTDLYLSRMMRYFIRTDNLREVLQLKQHFEPEEDSLCSDDWTELSGYLLDKYYGELSPSEEYLRYEIEGLRNLLLRAVRSNPENPVALYNLSRYFINTSENEYIESALQESIEKFNSAKSLKNRDIYKYIDAYRLLGEYYADIDDFLQAQEQFAEGIDLYITERDNAGFKGNKGVGKLYEDMGNLKYSISGDYEEALLNYNQSVNLGNDSPAIRYRIGYVQYHNRNYDDALAAFMKAGDGNIKERNLLLAMANTLSIRGDDYAAEGYYNQLIETLDSDIADRGLILPQANEKDYNIVNTYLCASNNYGVTLYRLAKKTGDSSKNAEAIVQFSESLRAWDALTRNPETMVRLEGSNLAEQNIKYITHPISEFEPAIYTSIPKTLLDNEGI